jgi:hypothetical protein
MAMVCPRCATTHEQLLQCPGCGDRLHYPESDTPIASETSPARWQHTPWGRILIGLLLAQGLFYGLRHLVTGVVLATGSIGEPSDETAAWISLITMQLLHAVALLAGGILAGSGQRNGAVLGAVVGVWNGVLTGLTPQSIGQSLSPVVLYGEPVLQMTLGAFAGWLGGAIWKPLPVPEHRGPKPVSRKPAPQPRAPLFAGRIAKVRVTLGTVLAVCGTLSATFLFRLMDKLTQDGPANSQATFDQLITWEIKALALIAGGALAGANTHNGLKQGLVVGFVSALVLAAVEPLGADRWVELTGLLLVSSTCLCLVGGWFGSQLFPPLVPFKRRHIGPEAMA